MSIAATGQGVKNLAIGVAILGGVVLAVYLIRNAADAARKVANAGAWLFGASDEATVGTWLYDKFNTPGLSRSTDAVLAKWGIVDEVQAIKTCNAIWSQNGEVKGEVCVYLRDQGKLTAP